MSDFLQSLLLSAAAGSGTHFSGYGYDLAGNQCLAIPSSCSFAGPVRSLISFLGDLQAQRSDASHASNCEIRSQLKALIHERVAFTRLHGNSPSPSLDALDHEIRALRSKLHPLLLLQNPNAREIITALPASPSQSLLVTLDDRNCRQLAATRTTEPIRLLARTLARGFTHQELVLPASQRRTAQIVAAPSLSILFFGSSQTIGRLLTCRTLHQEGLAQHILTIPDYPDDGCNSGTSSFDEVAKGRLQHLVNLRDLQLINRLTVSPAAGAMIETLKSGGKKPPMIQILKIALALQSDASDDSVVDEAIIAQAVKFATECRAFARRLAVEREDTSSAAARTMLHKLRERGPISFRDLVRTYRVQTRAIHGKTLQHLLDSGAVTLDSKGLIRVSSGAKAFDGVSNVAV